MLLRAMLIAGSALAACFAFAAPASAAPYYRCGDDWCYDDQYEETRALNLMALEDAEDKNDDDYDHDYWSRRWHDGDGDDDDQAPWDDGDDDDD